MAGLLRGRLGQQGGNQGVSGRGLLFAVPTKVSCAEERNCDGTLWHGGASTSTTRDLVDCTVLCFVLRAAKGLSCSKSGYRPSAPQPYPAGRQHVNLWGTPCVFTAPSITDPPVVDRFVLVAVHGVSQSFEPPFQSNSVVPCMPLCAPVRGAARGTARAPIGAQHLAPSSWGSRRLLSGKMPGRNASSSLLYRHPEQCRPGMPL